MGLAVMANWILPAPGMAEGTGIQSRAWEVAPKELGCETRHLAWKVCGCLCVPQPPQGHQLAQGVTFSQVTACQGHLAAQLRVRDAFPCCSKSKGEILLEEGRAVSGPGPEEV